MAEEYGFFHKGQAVDIDGVSYRVLDVVGDPEKPTECKVECIDLQNPRIKTRRFSFDEFRNKFENGTVSFPESNDTFVPEDEISPDDRELMENRQRVIEEALGLIYPNYDAFEHRRGKEVIQYICDKLVVSDSSARSLLNKYLKSGRNSYELLDKRQGWNNKEKAATVVNGRMNKDGTHSKVTLNDETLNNFEMAFRYFRENCGAGANLSDAYNYLLDIYYTDEETLQRLPDDECPSYRRFRSYVEKQLKGTSVRDFTRDEREKFKALPEEERRVRAIPGFGSELPEITETEEAKNADSSVKLEEKETEAPESAETLATDEISGTADRAEAEEAPEAEVQEETKALEEAEVPEVTEVSDESKVPAETKIPEAAEKAAESPEAVAAGSSVAAAGMVAAEGSEAAPEEEQGEVFFINKEEDLSAEESAEEEAATAEPVPDEPVSAEPVAEKAAAEESIPEEPVAGEPAPEEPAAQQPEQEGAAPEAASEQDRKAEAPDEEKIFEELEVDVPEGEKIFEELNLEDSETEKKHEDEIGKREAKKAEREREVSRNKGLLALAAVFAVAFVVLLIFLLKKPSASNPETTVLAVESEVFTTVSTEEKESTVELVAESTLVTAATTVEESAAVIVETTAEEITSAAEQESTVELIPETEPVKETEETSGTEAPEEEASEESETETESAAAEEAETTAPAPDAQIKPAEQQETQTALTKAETDGRFYRVTGSSVNVRSSANKEQILDSVPQGTLLERTGDSKDENWLEIDYRGQKACIYTSYVEKIDSGGHGQFYRLTGDGVRVRDAQDRSVIYTSLAKGIIIEETGSYPDAAWIRFQWNNKDVVMSRQYLEPVDELSPGSVPGAESGNTGAETNPAPASFDSTAVYYRITGERVNVRNARYKEVAIRSYPKGMIVQKTAESDDTAWLHTNIGGKDVVISTAYLEPVREGSEQGLYRISSETANIYAASETKGAGEQLDTLPKGLLIQPENLEENSLWLRFDWKGRKAVVSREDVEEV